ncbi:hypothetical protein SUGI_1119000 [Cryptomeria japonica]|uniref:tetratricopeptide repeat domain-containing protein PYG7, chloroplastic n=1 Tax=Cryptomeria japonica TaxID=3369 RepID=UPI002414A1ED|nr:tetratricopeptide repeat domain-containing protein PYG7, chloroplastic [Cryptomeria japonica]GLJ52578.1 hypothetical protein SUGI_1119000 [Cryptomeria japonica]
MNMALAITQPALGLSCRHHVKSKRHNNSFRSTQGLPFAAWCLDNNKSTRRIQLGSQLCGATGKLHTMSVINLEVIHQPLLCLGLTDSKVNLHLGEDYKQILESQPWAWIFLPGLSSASSLADVAFASEEETSNEVFMVGELFEFGIQLIYLGALLALLGIGSFFVVRQILVRRELENAAKELQERVRTGEASSLEYFELGAVMLRKKFYPLAAKYLEQAIEKWEGDVQDLAQVHNTLGFSYVSEGKIDKSIGQFEMAVKLQPGYVTAWNNLGDAYEKKKKLRDALKAYDQALLFDPNNKVARRCRNSIKERLDLFEGIPTKSER